MKKLIMPFHRLMSLIGIAAALFGIQYLVFDGNLSSTEVYAGPCKFVSWDTSKGLKAKVTCEDEFGLVGSPSALNEHIMSNPEAFSDCRMFVDTHVTCTIPDDTEEEE